MRAVKAIREERDDVFEIWDIVKTINTDDVVISTDTMIEETTVDVINKKIFDLKEQIQVLAELIKNEEIKLDLIKNL